MQSNEQVIANYQQLLGVANYELATTRAFAQQVSQQLSEAQAEIAALKAGKPTDSSPKSARKK